MPELARVVAGRLRLEVRLQVLLAVHDVAVDQLAARAVGFVADLLHAQHAVEIARHDDGALVELDRLPQTPQPTVDEQRGEVEHAIHQRLAPRLPQQQQRAEHERAGKLEIGGQDAAAPGCRRAPRRCAPPSEIIR